MIDIPVTGDLVTLWVGDEGDDEIDDVRGPGLVLDVGPAPFSIVTVLWSKTTEIIRHDCSELELLSEDDV